MVEYWLHVFEHFQISCSIALATVLIIEFFAFWSVYGRPIWGRDVEQLLVRHEHTFIQSRWGPFRVLCSTEARVPYISQLDGLTIRFFFGYYIAHRGMVWRWSRAHRMIEELFNSARMFGEH